MNRAWLPSDIETILDLIREHAPWRDPYSEPAFVASFLNAFQDLEHQSNLSKETLLAWWQATEEYQNEWPKWVEKNKTPEPNPVANLIQGRVRISGSGYNDDNGPITPIGIHLGDLFSLFVRDTNRAEEAVKLARVVGYGLIQYWLNLGSLGGSYWSGREVGPWTTPNYFAQYISFMNMLKQNGMKAILCGGDFERLDRNFFRELGRHTDDTAALCIIGNEAWQTGADNKEELIRCMEAFKETSPLTPCSTTAPPNEHADEFDKWTRGDFYAVHGFREGEDHDRIRHIFSVPWESHPKAKFGWQDEPTGPGSEVSVKANHNYHGRDVHADHVAALAVQSLIAGQGFNFFCSEGIKYNENIVNRPGFKEVPHAASLVPKDIMSWELMHFGNSQQKRLLAPGKDDHTRFDHRIAPDGRVFGHLYGDEGVTSVIVKRRFEGVCRNVDGTQADSWVVNPGQAISVHFQRSVRTSYIIEGKIV